MFFSSGSPVVKPEVPEAITTEIFCTLKLDGIHHWPGCDIPEVEYLKHPHRHLFHIKAHAFVNHDDRDLEFIKLQHEIRDYLFGRYWNETFNCLMFGAMSCEMIARELIETFELSMCEVSEDGENGAILTVNYL